MWKACKFETENRIAVLTMNRPEQLNALNVDMFEDVIRACELVNRDENLKVLIITGAGRGFSAGGDIFGLATISDAESAHEIFDHSTRMVKAVYDLEKPVIAAVNGPVAGASISLMMACDLIIAAESASFSYSFTNVAFCPDSGCSYFLTKRVGYNKAFEILAFGKKLDVNEAFGLGLVNLVVPTDKVMIQAEDWANKLASGPLKTIGMDKKILRTALTNDFDQVADLEGNCQVEAWLSEDFKEGAVAFLEKRRPDFKGR